MFTLMDFYPYALFLHIVGALGLFVTLGLEWAGLSNLRRAATAEQAGEWFKLLASLRRLYAIVWLTILIPGFYMAALVWRGVPWITTALAAIVLLVILGMGLGRRRMATIVQEMAAESGQPSSILRQRLNDPVLWASLWIRTAIALGIVFLMVVKPGMLGALLTMSVAILLGVAFSLPALNRGRKPLQTRQTGDSL
jgi:hypothetical protein